MKKLLLFLSTALLLACSNNTEKTTRNDNTPPVFELHKGVNLSHWLSQCFGWSPRESFITEQDIRFIDSIGMDHVRIPMDEKEMWNDDGTKNDSSFAYLHQCIAWCKKYDLKILVDLHIIKAHHFNSHNGEGKNTLFTDTLAQQKFVELWYDISDELKQYSTDLLAYEFLNEPVAKNPEDWNKLIARCYKEIRNREPDRFILIGSNNWQTPGMFPFLKVPENDKRIILAFHYYEPLFITHYTAYWTSFKNYKGPVQYPGWSIPLEEVEKLKQDTANHMLLRRIEESNKYYTIDTLAKYLQPVFDKSKALGLPVVCTEFGAYNRIDPELRRKYYTDIMKIFKDNNIAWTIWDLKGDFGLLKYDRKNYTVTGVDTMVVNTIMKK